MNSKFVPTKYLAIVLMGIVVLILVAFDAFSATEIKGAINKLKLVNVISDSLVINK